MARQTRDTAHQGSRCGLAASDLCGPMPGLRAVDPVALCLNGAPQAGCNITASSMGGNLDLAIAEMTPIQNDQIHLHLALGLVRSGRFRWLPGHLFVPG